MQYTPGVLQTVYNIHPIYNIYHIYRFAAKLLPNNYWITMISMVLQVCYQVTTKQLLDNYDVYGIYSVYSVYRDFQSLLMQEEMEVECQVLEKFGTWCLEKPHPTQTS